MSQTPLYCPSRNSVCFGFIPEIKTKYVKYPSGEIRLPEGKHFGPHKGFGAKHIWFEHQEEMTKRGFEEYSNVSDYVASILQEGTPIFLEEIATTKARIMAVRSTKGTCVLELREQREQTIWSVVTAYSGTTPQGTKVGLVQKCAESKDSAL